jgi:D-alanyl-D-alanine dipeptidase
LRRAERAGPRFYIFILTAALVSTGAAADPARHPGFVDAAESVAGLQLDIRYFGNHNFIGKRIDGYEAPLCLLTRETATALGAVQGDLEALGLGLKVFDCYRPARAVAHFVRWHEIFPTKGASRSFIPKPTSAIYSGMDIFRRAPATRADRRST